MPTTSSCGGERPVNIGAMERSTTAKEDKRLEVTGRWRMENDR
jgi:NADPH-dependent glutamate synthase beta subunit-like oxidoreductase